MRITCPACSTRYVVDPRAIGVAGRKVRCARCQHVWRETVPEDAVPVGLTEPAPTPQPPPEDIPPPRFQLPAVPPPRRSRWLAAGWVALAAAVVLSIGLLSFYRHDLFPAQEALGAGLDFRNLRAGGEKELVLEGEVVNTTLTFRRVPPFKAAVYADGKEAAVTRFNVEEKELPPGGTASFRATLPRPSQAAAEIRVQVDEGT